MKKILVTGTAGFIGFFTAQKLLDSGFIVIGIDCLNDYYDVSYKKRRLAQLESQDSYIHSSIDFCDYDALQKLVLEHKPDKIIHLGAQAGVRYSLENPWEYERINSLGTLNILEVARQHSIKRVVLASSSSVYGGNTKTPFSENDSVDTPVSLYAATKRHNELQAHVYHHLYDVSIICLRFFTVYGPYMRPDLALFKFVRAILLDEEISLYNNGEMMRDFTYIGDIVDGIVRALDCTQTYEIYNLGGDNPVSLKKLVSLIEDSLGKKARITLLPMQPGDVKVTMADVSKARTDLGFNPSTPIEEIVSEFCEWFLANKEWLLHLEKGKQ